jgi:hypothetical protein
VSDGFKMFQVAKLDLRQAPNDFFKARRKKGTAEALREHASGYAHTKKKKEGGGKGGK